MKNFVHFSRFHFLHWFAAPVFAGDEAKTHKAALLNIIFIILLIGMPLLIASAFIDSHSPAFVLILSVAFYIFCWVLKFLLNKGYVYQSGIVLIALAFMILTTILVELGVVHEPLASVYILIILIAGVLFNRRGFIPVAVLSSLVVLGLSWLECAGSSAYSFYPLAFSEWLTWTMVFICTGAINFWTSQISERALARAAQEAAERIEAEKALRESEERYRAQFKNLPVPAYTWQRVGDHFVLIDYNDAANTHTGGTIANLLGKSHLELYADEPAILEDSEYCYTHQTIVRRELRFALRSTGQVRDVDFTYVFVPPDLIVVHAEDITECKATEVALHKSKQILQEAQLLANIGGWTEDIPTATFDISPEAARLAGWTPGIHTSSEFIEIIYPDDRELVLAAWEAAKRGAPYDYEHRFIVNGEVRWVHAAAEFTFNPDGEAQLAFGVIQDITERKRAEDALRDSELLYHTLFENIQDAINFIDLMTREIIDCNSRFCEMNGYRRDELIGQSINIVHDEEAAKILNNPQTLAPLLDHLRQAGVLRAEGTHRTRDGRIIEIETCMSVITIHGREMIVGIDRDITERKRSEKALRESEAQLQELNRLLEERVQQRTSELQLSNRALGKALQAKTEFMAAMSHELRTPLTAILGLSEILQLNQYNNLNEKQLKSIGSIEKSGQRLLELINNVIDFSRLQSGDLDLQLDTISLAEICKASLQSVRILADARQQRLDFRITDETIRINGDARHLKQVLINLLNNAVKFTPEGGSIELAVAGFPDERQVKISVSDTGIGIRKEDLPKLFRPFVQLDASFARKYEGAGLGLALVKALVELQGGSIEVESVFGQGSCFSVTLPWKAEK